MASRPPPLPELPGEQAPSVSTVTTSSSTTSARPPNGVSSSPSQRQRMINAVSQRIGAVGALLTSPFRDRPPSNVNQRSSPESSLISELTGTSADNRNGYVPSESAESINAQLRSLYHESGDGGDSDEEGAEADLHYSSVTSHEEDETTPEDAPDDGDVITPLAGAPEGWEIPTPPPSFKGYMPKEGSGAPSTFEEVDNPAGWTDYMFQPKYKGTVYEGHFTPCGAKVAPVGDDGKRVVNGWEFIYSGWTPDEFDIATYSRSPATANNLKPKERGGKLNVNRLKKYGINKDTSQSPLHLYNLLLPIHDPSKTGIADDGRMPFYSRVAQCTNLYAMSKGLGSGYNHKYQTVSELEMVHWAGVLVRHGARSGQPMGLHYRWIPNDPDYDAVIADGMTLTRWRQIKSVFKLNNNMVAPQKGSAGYDPCNKYDLIYKALTYNMNYFTETACLDYGLDETTWGFMGYSGECGGRLMNKKVSKGEHCICL